MSRGQKRIPKLRFPGFDGEWEEKRLSEICDFEQGLQVDLSLQSKVIKPGFINFVRIENVTQNSDDYRFISTELSRNKILKKTDIIVVRYGATAGFIGRGFSGVLANNLFTVKPKRDGIQLDYLYVYLRSEKTYSFFQSEMAGGAMPALSFGIAGSLLIPIPSLPEQQKIADFLSVVDRKIEQLVRKKALLEDYKKGVMQKIFSQKLRFKDENGKGYPKWEEKKLGDVAEFFKGKGIGKDDIDPNGHIECIRYGELYTSYSEHVGEVVSRTKNSDDLFLGKKNDVIIPASGETSIDIARAAYLPRDGIALGGDINIIRTNEYGLFLAYYLNNAKKMDIAKMAQGNAVVHLYARQLSHLEIRLPSLPEQQKIADFLSALDAKVEKVAAQIEKSREFKKGLLQQMFA